MLLLSFFQSLWSLVTICVYVAAYPALHNSDVTFVELGKNPVNCTMEHFWNPNRPTPKDWAEHDMNERLYHWWSQHEEDIMVHGLAATFGIWALDTPDFDCLLGGSDANCEFQVSCDNDALNRLSEDDARFAYYMLKSLQNVHAYFNVQREAFETAALSAAFRNDGFAHHFDHEEQRDLGLLAIILGAAQMVFSLGAAMAPAFAATEAALSGSVAYGTANNLFAGLNNVMLGALKKEGTDQGVKAAELGMKLGKTVLETSKLLIVMNDELMKGRTVLGLGDMRDMLKSGIWLNYNGFDQIKMIDAFSDRLTAQAINIIWRAQKCFIIGGGRCGDGQGVGTGPQDGVWCRKSDNTAWYLYHWQDYHGPPLATDKKWGFITWPHGMYDLGKGDYARITVEEVIESSVRTYEAQMAAQAASLKPHMKFEYTTQDVVNTLVKDLMSGRSFFDDTVRAPFVFTIPVANISLFANGEPTEWSRETHFIDKILMPYTTKDHEHRAHFCGPIAEGHLDITRHWMEAANMHGFKSPVHLCDDKKFHVVINRFTQTKDGYSDGIY